MQTSLRVSGLSAGSLSRGPRSPCLNPAERPTASASAIGVVKMKNNDTNNEIAVETARSSVEEQESSSLPESALEATADATGEVAEADRRSGAARLPS
jgi:hypothetical protein